MASRGVQVRGLDKVQNTLKKLGNPNVLFDEPVRKTALNSLRDLQINSLSDKPQIPGMNTGSTSRAWTNPFKVTGAHYRVSNSYKTRDKKYNVVKLLDEGRGEIRPKKKSLYIPLNKKAAQKKPGAKIPDDLVMGEDFVFAKSAKAVQGRKFLDKNIKTFSNELTKRIIAEIRKAVK